MRTALMTFPLLVLLGGACTGPTGSTGAQGEQGPPGEEGPEGPTGVPDAGVIAQQIANDPEFRRQLVELLVAEHGEELKGEPGAEGVCDCGDGGGELPTCLRPCESGEDCPPTLDCVDGGCVYVGCSSDDECSNEWICR